MIPKLATVPFLLFFFYGIYLIAEKKIDPTPLDALIIVASGLIAALMLYLIRLVEVRIHRLA